MTGRLIEFKEHFDKVYGDGVGKETITRSAFPETKFKFRRSKLILKLNLKPRELGFNYPVEIIIDNIQKYGVLDTPLIVNVLRYFILIMLTMKIEG